jgi:hypothetical protein
MQEGHWQTMSQATKDQISYVTRARSYLEEALTCKRAEPPLWRLGVVALGSALESLLRMQYGRPKDLFALIDTFDADPYWNQFQLHLGATKQCSTCSIDAIRKQRNSVHPHLWCDCTDKEFDHALMAVLLMQHILIHCEGSRIADFPSGIAFDDVFREATEEEARALDEVETDVKDLPEPEPKKPWDYSKGIDFV